VVCSQNVRNIVVIVTAWPRGIFIEIFGQGLYNGILLMEIFAGTTCCIHEDMKLRRKDERERSSLIYNTCPRLLYYAAGGVPLAHSGRYIM
jgi:hypothetical protein